MNRLPPLFQSSTGSRLAPILVGLPLALLALSPHIASASGGTHFRYRPGGSHRKAPAKETDAKADGKKDAKIGDAGCGR